MEVKFIGMKVSSRLRSVNPWVFISAIILAWLFFGVTLAITFYTRPVAQPEKEGTAILSIIYSATDTPIPSTPTPVPSATPLPPEGVIYVGGFAQVVGTGGDGLRLRFNPGLEGQVRLLAGEGEIYQVLEGPQQVNDYTWWYLENPQDSERRGWAVADFLQAVAQP